LSWPARTPPPIRPSIGARDSNRIGSESDQNKQESLLPWRRQRQRRRRPTPPHSQGEPLRSSSSRPPRLSQLSPHCRRVAWCRPSPLVSLPAPSAGAYIPHRFVFSDHFASSLVSCHVRARGPASRFCSRRWHRGRPLSAAPKRSNSVCSSGFRSRPAEWLRETPPNRLAGLLDLGLRSFRLLLASSFF
jgi:hypothetical protein